MKDYRKIKVVKTLIIFLSISLNLGCQNSGKTSKNEKESELKIKDKFYESKEKYEFDEAIYYKLDEEINFIPKNQETSEGQLIIGIMYGDEPVKMESQNFPKQLEKIGFIKSKIVNKEYLEVLSSSMVIVGKPDPYIVNSCLSTYRDIVILKKENKIVGIAKICFSCGSNYLIGGHNTRADEMDNVELGLVSKIFKSEIKNKTQ